MLYNIRKEGQPIGCPFLYIRTYDVLFIFIGVLKDGQWPSLQIIRTQGNSIYFFALNHRY